MPLKYSTQCNRKYVIDFDKNRSKDKKKKKKWKDYQTVLLKRLIRVYGLGKISVLLPYFHDKTTSDINSKIRTLTKSQNISQYSILRIDTDKVGIMNTLLCLLEEKHAMEKGKRPRTLLKTGQRKNQGGKFSLLKKAKIFEDNSILYDEEPPEDLLLFNIRDHMETLREQMKKRNEYNVNLKNKIEEALKLIEK